MLKRFKLYKSGKIWCVAAIATAMITLGTISLNANADSVNGSENIVTEQISATVSSENSVNSSSMVANSSAKSDIITVPSVTSTEAEQETAATSATVASGVNNSNNNEEAVDIQATATATLKAAATTSTLTETTTPENGWNSNHTVYYKNGQTVNGYVQADDGNYYMFKDGVRQSGVQKWMGTYYYFDPTTYLRVDNDYREQVWEDGSDYWYMFGEDGKIVTGTYNWQGSLYYFDPYTYLRVDNQYISTLADGRGYLFGGDGRAVSGVNWWVGTYYYFDPVTHLRVDNDYREQIWADGTHNWYMFGDNGQIITGPYSWQGSLYYFDPSTYLKVTNDYRVPAGETNGYLLGDDGRALTGFQTWQGTTYYFDPSSYKLVTNGYFYVNGQLYWADKAGFISKVNNMNAINTYIVDTIGLNNHATITYQYVIPNVTGAYSGTSDGKPNMVVVHETANPNDSIQGEINYEKNNYNSAFVHAFVDNNNIIEISSTDKEAWGAAYPANGRAVQFEQVEVYGKEAFARELMNAAYYTAYIMKKYNMTPSLAQADGSGTLWSHHNVSQYLGGTNHTDPDGYWTKNAKNYFGTTYTMSDFLQLVQLYYNSL